MLREVQIVVANMLIEYNGCGSHQLLIRTEMEEHEIEFLRDRLTQILETKIEPQPKPFERVGDPGVLIDKD